MNTITQIVSDGSQSYIKHTMPCEQCSYRFIVDGRSAIYEDIIIVRNWSKKDGYEQVVEQAEVGYI
jgi:DNA-directed RNA polymerase subunit RPC12/RpoP